MKGLEVANDSHVEEKVERSCWSTRKNHIDDCDGGSRHVAVTTNTTSSNQTTTGNWTTTETGDDGIDHLRRRMEMVGSPQARFPL